LAKEILTKEEIKNKLLLATNSEGNTAWHLAAISGNVDVVQEIWNLVKEYLTTEEIESKLIIAKCHDRNTPRMLAAELGK
jgi:ankyrin repeat protein